MKVQVKINAGIFISDLQSYLIYNVNHLIVVDIPLSGNLKERSLRIYLTLGDWDWVLATLCIMLIDLNTHTARALDIDALHHTFSAIKISYTRQLLSVALKEEPESEKIYITLCCMLYSRPKSVWTHVVLFTINSSDLK